MGWGEGDNIGGQIHAVTVFFKILPLGSPIIWSSIINTSTLGGEGLGNDVECGVVFSNGDVVWKIAKTVYNGGLAEDAVSGQDEHYCSWKDNVIWATDRVTLI